MPDLAAHLDELKTRGYTRLTNAVPQSVIARLRARIQELHAAAQPLDQRAVPALNRGHAVLYNLQNRDPLFITTLLDHADLRHILIATLNDEWYRQIPRDCPNYIMRAVVARSSGPEALPLHIDSFVPASGSFAWAVQAAIVLEDQHPSNGCTVVVPGSHQFDRYADQASMALAEPIMSKAGDLVVWDSRLWHGTTANQSGATRWSLIATFTRWWLKQNYDVTGMLPDAIYDALSDEHRAVLGFCSIPPRDELERVDVKAGYELLQAGRPGRPARAA